MATKTQIRVKVLKMLGVLGLGRSASSDQAADIDAAYDEVYEELAEENLVEWASTEEVPAKFVSSMVALVASRRVNEYAVSTERYQRIMTEASQAEPKIRTLIAGSYVPTVTPFTDY